MSNKPHAALMIARFIQHKRKLKRNFKAKYPRKQENKNRASRFNADSPVFSSVNCGAAYCALAWLFMISSKSPMLRAAVA